MTFRIVFALLAAFTGLTAAFLLFEAAMHSKNSSTLEAGVAVVGGIVALALIVFAFKTARKDVEFRSRHKLRRRA